MAASPAPRPTPRTTPKEGPAAGRRLLPVPRFVQPDDVTCGPTCLLQIYRAYGDPRPFPEVDRSVRRNEDGGTLAPFLGLSALGHGYRARIRSFNLRIFDPTWTGLSGPALRSKLRRRAAFARDLKLASVLRAYDEFLAAGGEVEFALDLTPRLLTKILDRGHPILAGLSSTHLYRSVRERPADNVDDDVHGEPMGHFVVLAGYTQHGATFHVRDPHRDVPFSRSGRYTITAERLINAVLLGVSTYDAVLLEVWPRRARRSS